MRDIAVGMGTPEERFERLYREHTDAILLYARRRATITDAADVHGEVFLIAWRRLEDIPEEAALPWLYGVAWRVLANQRRGQRRQSDLIARVREDAPQRVSVDAPALGDPSLLAALRTLSDDDQEVLRLIAWEELAPREAARVLGCHPATCRVRIHRARRRLAAALTLPTLEPSPDTARGATCDLTTS